jgi:hypothetical protein
VLLIIGVISSALLAQDQQPCFVGNPLGLPVSPAADRAFEAISWNVKVYKKQDNDWKLLALTFSSVRNTHSIEH